MRLTLIFLLVGLLSGAQAQSNYNNGWGGKQIRGNRDVITENRSVRNFDGVAVCCGMRVELTESNNFSVEVKAESNIMEYVRTEVSGGRLEIGFKGQVNIKTNETVVVYVSMPTIDYAGASSGSKLVGMSSFRGEDLEIDASSGAKVELAFTGSRIRANASSAGKIQLEGTGTRIKARASSGASVRAGDFRAQRGDANASSGGGVTVYVTDELEADASSGGGVRYRGNPANVDADRSSGGSVRKVN